VARRWDQVTPKDTHIHTTREHGDASPPTDTTDGGAEEAARLCGGAIARATRTREIAAGQSELVARDPTSPRAGP